MEAQRGQGTCPMSHSMRDRGVWELGAGTRGMEVIGLRPLSWGYPEDAEPSPSPRVWFTTLGAPWQARGGKFHDSHKARGGSQQLLCSGLSDSSPSLCSRPGGQGREAA